mmetsp:Transcript_60151/g.137965  ORF Transcript_60151/g.137965 Transcript_60151/m.137965 type:complete len:224 (-) Transcript_60151:543-1214(-)
MAPAGSSIARVSSKQSRTAAQISSLLTVTMSSTSSSHSRKTSGPICVTAAPSTKCDGSGTSTRWPARRDCCSKLLSAGSTPMTLVVGMTCLTASAIPASSDEPPVHTKMASRWCVLAAPPVASSTARPCCRVISRPAVACPAMTRGSSCGWRKAIFPFDSAASRSASACASFNRRPYTCTTAPARSIACLRESGVRSGTTIIGGSMPRRCAATASECPWLPIE